MKRTLPEEVFVIREKENDGSEYLTAEEDIDDFATVGETRRVGVYRLVKELDVTVQVIAKDA